MSARSEARAVLADLYEEVTGDPEKRWPPEWMAVQLVKARPSQEHVVISLVVEAGGNAHLVSAALSPNSFSRQASQPIWLLINHTDESRLFVDHTDESRLFVDLSRQYQPEMEVAVGDSTGGGSGRFDHFQLYRFILAPYSETEWYVNSLGDIARFFNVSRRSLVRAIRSNNPWDRAWAYEAIAGFHGYDEFDQYSLYLTEDELAERWSDASLPRENPWTKPEPLHIAQPRSSRFDEIAHDAQRRHAVDPPRSIEDEEAQSASSPSKLRSGAKAGTSREVYRERREGLLALLREGPLTVDELFARAPHRELYADRPAFVHVLRQLVKEGVIYIDARPARLGQPLTGHVHLIDEDR